MATIGISCFYHDSAVACLNSKGEIICAVQEERFSRIRHDSSFPKHALAFCVDQVARVGEKIEAIIFYEDPLNKFDRIIYGFMQAGETARDEFNHIMSKWLGGHLYQVDDLRNGILSVIPDFDVESQLFFTEHHTSHAASAFYPSPFESAAILTIDGVGEYNTATIGLGQSNSVSIVKELNYPDSLGLLYSAFTHYTGFKVNSGEYKMMGLAPYGSPRFAKRIKEHFIDVRDDGSFHLNQEYFDYFVKDHIINQRFDQVLGVDRRAEVDELLPVYADIAASIQKVTEEVVIKMVQNAQQVTGQGNLCMAGGVALNSVANGKIERECALDGLWIQPAAGDAGGALGAAYYYYYHITQHPRVSAVGSVDRMQGALLGPAYSDEDIVITLDNMGARYTTIGYDNISQHTAKLIAEGKTVAWFQGKMEFGPRALGNRSILADPRSGDMQKVLNLRIKKRESFRPFAPSVLEEHANRWFKLTHSPYMLLVAQVQDEVSEGSDETLDKVSFEVSTDSKIPAVTHVDNSARVQTVSKESNRRYHELISAFYEITNCPVVVNTSFNVRGEPIVCSPEDAFKCFLNTELDYLVIGQYVLQLSEQDQLIKWKHQQSFKSD